MCYLDKKHVLVYTISRMYYVCFTQSLLQFCLVTSLDRCVCLLTRFETVNLTKVTCQNKNLEFVENGIERERECVCVIHL